MALWTGEISSKQLGMDVGVKVIFPQNTEEKDLKVLYLLHGLSDGCGAWGRYTRIESYANEQGYIVIMPEVHRSFYTDMKYGRNYFTYITEELPAICKKMFRIPTEREKTFVAGLSMGGYGALKCALSLPNNYAACAAFSSACNIVKRLEEFRNKESEFIAIAGEKDVISPKEDLYHLAKETNKLGKEEKPRILMTCGTEDFLHQDNLDFKEYMNTLDYEYTYEEWAGVHDWYFWETSIKKALNFFGEK